MDKQTIENEELLNELEQNAPINFSLGKRTFRIHRLCNETSIKIYELMRSLELDKIKASDDIMSLPAKSRRVVAKVISLVILKRTWKIGLFHWALWRWVSNRYSQEEYLPIISKVIQNTDLSFFSTSLTSLRMAAMAEMKMSKEDITSIAAKQKSESETT